MSGYIFSKIAELFSERSADEIGRGVVDDVNMFRAVTLQRMQAPGQLGEVGIICYNRRGQFHSVSD